MLLPPPRSTLFPYTTLFRSARERPGGLLPRERVRLEEPGAVWPAGTDRPGAHIAPDGSCRPYCRSEEHTSELQSRFDLVCRLLLEKKKNNQPMHNPHTFISS